jgi:hypothetical protein
MVKPSCQPHAIDAICTVQCAGCLKGVEGDTFMSVSVEGIGTKSGFMNRLPMIAAALPSERKMSRRKWLE